MITRTGPRSGPSTRGTTATCGKAQWSFRTESRVDATSIVILRPVPLAQVSRRISPAAVWRARDVERDLLLAGLVSESSWVAGFSNFIDRSESERPQPLQYRS